MFWNRFWSRRISLHGLRRFGLFTGGHFLWFGGFGWFFGFVHVFILGFFRLFCNNFGSRRWCVRGFLRGVKILDYD